VDLQKTQALVDSEIRRFNAGQVNTVNAQNIQNRLTALRMDDTFVTDMSQQWITAERDGNTAAMDAIKTKINAALAKASADAAWRKEILDDVGKAFQIGSGGTAPTPSDRRLKKDIKEIDPESIDEFLRTVGAGKTWSYKNPADGKGGQIGPMAQDVERSELGRSAVSRRGDGMRTVDYRRMAALALAGAARLSDRLDRVEGGKKRRAPPDVAGFARARRSA
jgi:hypothetical protein